MLLALTKLARRTAGSMRMRALQVLLEWHAPMEEVLAVTRRTGHRLIQETYPFLGLAALVQRDQSAGQVASPTSSAGCLVAGVVGAKPFDPTGAAVAARAPRSDYCPVQLATVAVLRISTVRHQAAAAGRMSPGRSHRVRVAGFDGVSRWLPEFGLVPLFCVYSRIFAPKRKFFKDSDQ